MNSPIKIQLAIQGGGARIVAIMAVLDALEELSDKIQVTRIVGTSAGAIAGAFFATGLGVKTIVDGWQKGELNKLSASLTIPRNTFLPSSFSIAWHLIKQTPLWSSNNIHNYLDSIFKKCEKRCVFFDDLENIKGVKVTVVSTNLRNRSSEESKGSDPIVSTLMDSSGLPYLLRKWNIGGNPVIVDGGIGDNLPATRLDILNLNETPVCISFHPEVGATANPSNFKDFSLALLEAAIDVSSKKSASLVPNTYYIDTSIRTFDFNDALKSISSGEYQKIKQAAHTWFSELHNSIKTRERQKAIAFSVTNLHPWESENATAQAVMTGIWIAIEKQFQDQCFFFRYVEMRATLGSLGQAGGNDTIKYTVEFEPDTQPLYCYWFGVSDGLTSQLTKEPTYEIQCVNTDEYVSHVRVPVKNPGESDARYMAIFFTPPLLPGNKYRLVQTEVGRNLVNKLITEKKDEMGVSPNRVKGSIDLAKLIVDMPQAIKHFTIKTQRGNKAEVVSELYPDTLRRNREASLLDGYNTHIVEGRNVVGLFAIDITIGS